MPTYQVTAKYIIRAHNANEASSLILETAAVIDKNCETIAIVDVVKIDNLKEYQEMNPEDLKEENSDICPDCGEFIEDCICDDVEADPIDDENWPEDLD